MAFAFEVYNSKDNRVGFSHKTATKEPSLRRFLERHPKQFEFDKEKQFWFFYPPEKYGHADAATGNIPGMPESVTRQFQRHNHAIKTKRTPLSFSNS